MSTRLLIEFEKSHKCAHYIYIYIIISYYAEYPSSHHPLVGTKILIINYYYSSINYELVCAYSSTSS